MRTTGTRRTVLIVANLLILIGIALMAWMIVTAASRTNIYVDLSDGRPHTVGFSDLSLVPGESTQYTVRLRNTNANKYNVHLDFVETEESMDLKNYARVRIISNDEILCDELLATVFENESIVLPVNFVKGTNTELIIMYYLPIEVGNEAKNAGAVFELQIMATNE